MDILPTLYYMMIVFPYQSRVGGARVLGMEGRKRREAAAALPRFGEPPCALGGLPLFSSSHF